MRKVNLNTAAGPNFSVRTEGDSPASFRVIYEGPEGTATAQIESGFDQEGRPDWLIYAETLEFDSAPKTSAEIDIVRTRILERMSSGLLALGMRNSIG